MYRERKTWEGISKGNVNSEIMNLFFFSLNCVFRLYFIKQFYLYKNKKPWRENYTHPCPDLAISASGTAILEVFECFHHHWWLQLISHRVLLILFIVLLGVSLSLFACHHSSSDHRTSCLGYCTGCIDALSPSWPRQPDELPWGSFFF